jgi:hypothetical protein
MCFSAQAQLGGVHIGPAQAEQLAASHTGLERSNDEILQVGLRMEPQTQNDSSSRSITKRSQSQR